MGDCRWMYDGQLLASGNVTPEEVYTLMYVICKLRNAYMRSDCSDIWVVSTDEF